MLGELAFRVMRLLGHKPVEVPLPETQQAASQLVLVGMLYADKLLTRNDAVKLLRMPTGLSLKEARAVLDNADKRRRL